MAKILSVAYDPVLGNTRQLILEREGYTVVTACSIDTALRSCATGEFDLVIVGHMVPTCDKTAMLFLLSLSCPNTPTLVLARPNECAFEGATATAEASLPNKWLEVVKNLLAKP